MVIPDPNITTMFRYMSYDMHFLTPEEIGPLNTAPAWEEQLLYDRCGKFPNSGTIFANPEKKAYLECSSRIIDAVAAKGAQDYLTIYGARDEKVPGEAKDPRGM